MTRSELIERLTKKSKNLGFKEIEDMVKTTINLMSDTLAQGCRIEIRGFGSFGARLRNARKGRNPRTGDEVSLSSKYVPHFKPGKELRDRVNSSKDKVAIKSDEA